MITSIEEVSSNLLNCLHFEVYEWWSPKFDRFDFEVCVCVLRHKKISLHISNRLVNRRLHQMQSPKYKHLYNENFALEFIVLNNTHTHTDTICHYDQIICWLLTLAVVCSNSHNFQIREEKKLARINTHTHSLTHFKKFTIINNQTNG